MILIATTDKLAFTRSSAAAVHITIDYTTHDASTGDFSAPGLVVAQRSSAATTAELTGPGGSSWVKVNRFAVANVDASLSLVLTVLRQTTGNPDNTECAVTLKPGETLEYTDLLGFNVLRPTGLLSVRLVVASDVANATTSFADITGLTYPLKSGVRYAWLAHVFTTNNASSTGSRFGYNIGAAPTVEIAGEIGAVTNSATAGALGIGQAVARDTAIVAQTTGQTAIGLHILSGGIQPSADGTFALRFASEVAVAAGVTVKALSWLDLRQEG